MHTATSLPFAHLNLRHNPFGELDTIERVELALADVDDVVARLHRPGFAVQFVDEKGCGKTTHLLALRRFLQHAPYVHVAEGDRPTVPRRRPLLLDEAQRLPPTVRRRIFARRGSIAIGTHEDLTLELVRAGFEVRTVRPSHHLSVERLRQIFALRIEWARRGEGRLPTIGIREVRELMERFGSDVRSMEAQLYESFQTMLRIDHGAL